jgi:hypothetical protein
MEKMLIVLLWAASLHAAPIEISILSGSVQVPPSQYTQSTAGFNLVTNTGTLTGWTVVGADYIGLLYLGPLPFSINPTLYMGGGNSVMTIVHNGISYGFVTYEQGSSPDHFSNGTYGSSTPLDITPNGPLTFTVPFTASMLLAENYQMDASTQVLYHYTGAGLATLHFNRFNMEGSSTYSVGFTGATFDFQSIPEPGMSSMIGLGIIAVLLFNRRVLDVIRTAGYRIK